MSTSENIKPGAATAFDGACGACDAAPALGMHSHKLGPEIGRRLSRIMKERGLVDRDLGELALMSHSAIYKLRHGFGGQVGVGTIWNIAKALGVSPAWLAFGVGPQELETKENS